MGSKNRKNKYKLLILLGFIILISLRFPSNEESIPAKEQKKISIKQEKLSEKKISQGTEKESESTEIRRNTTDEVDHQNYNEIISCYPSVSGNKWKEVYDSVSKNYPKIFEQKINRHYKSIDGREYQYRLYVDREGNKEEDLFEVKNDLPYKTKMFSEVHLMKLIYDEETTILINDNNKVFESVKVDNKIVFFEGFSEEGILACELDSKEECLCSRND